MALQQIIDATEQIVENSGVFIQDMGDYNTAIVLLANPTEPITFYHTNDAGAIQGVTDGSAILAGNFTLLAGENCADTAYNADKVTSATDGDTVMIKFTNFGRFVKFYATSGNFSMDKLILRLYKI